MERDILSEWSLALDEDLLHGPDSAVMPPDPSPWSRSSAGIWSSETSFPAVLNQYTKDQHYTFPLSTETQSQTVQTENFTEESSTNTKEDWESDMRALEDYSIELTQQYEALTKQHAAEKEEHNVCFRNLEKSKEERNHQYQSFIEKIESLHMKLELNSSKTTRKNFMVKRQELTAEKERMEKEKARLAQELEEADQKLKMLIEEQNQEKLTWEQEIANLRVEMETLCRQAKQASQTALQDEIDALNMQKVLVISQVEDWIADAERYWNYLRLNPSQQNFQKRQKWEQNVKVVVNSLSSLKNKFNENHQLLQQGEPLDSLPSISRPVLPPVPLFELIMTSLQNPVPHPVFSSGPPTSNSTSFVHPQMHASTTPPQAATPPPSAPKQTMIYPPVSSAMGPQSQLSFPNPCLPQTLYHSAVTPAQTHIGVSGVSVAPPGTYVGLPNNPGAGFHPQSTARLPQTFMQTPSTRNPTPQPLPSNSAPAGKLDKLLEKLGSHFPQCTREQLTRVLQQIKSERGTMAGLSMDDVTAQVAQKLAQNQRLPPGPIAPPSGTRAFPSAVGPIQRPTAQQIHPMRHHFRAPVAQGFYRPPQSSARRFCLMCQNQVEVGTQYNTNCSHTMHKDCVSVWLKTSKNNSCPFCPSK